MKHLGLAPLDAIEVKQRDKQYRRTQAINSMRSKLVWKQFNARGHKVDMADYEALEDQLDREGVS